MVPYSWSYKYHQYFVINLPSPKPKPPGPTRQEPAQPPAAVPSFITQLALGSGKTSEEDVGSYAGLKLLTNTKSMYI